VPNVPWHRASAMKGPSAAPRIIEKITVVIGIYDLCTVRNTNPYFYTLSILYVLVSVILNMELHDFKSLRV